jgi:hypothetical protein
MASNPSRYDIYPYALFSSLQKNYRVVESVQKLELKECTTICTRWEN